MTDRCKSCDHDTQSHAEDGSGCLFEVMVRAVGSDRICPCTLDAYQRPRCKASEGATGIDCALEVGHQGEHEAQHTPGKDGLDGIGWPLFVRWPYQPWDLERGIAPHTEGAGS